MDFKRCVSTWNHSNGGDEAVELIRRVVDFEVNVSAHQRRRPPVHVAVGGVAFDAVVGRDANGNADAGLFVQNPQLKRRSDVNRLERNRNGR